MTFRTNKKECGGLAATSFGDRPFLPFPLQSHRFDRKCFNPNDDHRLAWEPPPMQAEPRAQEVGARRHFGSAPNISTRLTERARNRAAARRVGPAGFFDPPWKARQLYAPPPKDLG